MPCNCYVRNHFCSTLTPSARGTDFRNSFILLGSFQRRFILCTPLVVQAPNAVLLAPLLIGPENSIPNGEHISIVAIKVLMMKVMVVRTWNGETASTVNHGAAHKAVLQTF